MIGGTVSTSASGGASANHIVWLVPGKTWASIWQTYASDETKRDRVFSQLSAYVSAGEIAYPTEVIQEVGEYIRKSDALKRWLSSHRKYSSKILGDGYYEQMDTVHCLVPRIYDDMAHGEQGDPFVIACVIALQERGHNPWIVTDDIHSTESRMSMTDACKSLDFSYEAQDAFLLRYGIY